MPLTGTKKIPRVEIREKCPRGCVVIAFLVSIALAQSHTSEQACETPGSVKTAISDRVEACVTPEEEEQIQSTLLMEIRARWLTDALTSLTEEVVAQYTRSQGRDRRRAMRLVNDLLPLNKRMLSLNATWLSEGYDRRDRELALFHQRELERIWGGYLRINQTYRERFASQPVP